MKSKNNIFKQFTQTSFTSVIYSGSQISDSDYTLLYDGVDGNGDYITIAKKDGENYIKKNGSDYMPYKGEIE